MHTNSLKRLSAKRLLQLSGEVIDELKDRHICRTDNNPLSDYTEWLVRKQYGWQLSPPNEKGFDLEEVGTQTRYEVKGHRVTNRNRSRQLSAIRDIEGRHFHYLIAVIYNEDFDVIRAMKIPRAVVREKGRISKHTNSVILHARDSLLKEKGVVDLTNDFKGFAP